MKRRVMKERIKGGREKKERRAKGKLGMKKETALTREVKVVGLVKAGE